MKEKGAVYIAVINWSVVIASVLQLLCQVAALVRAEQRAHCNEIKEENDTLLAFYLSLFTVSDKKCCFR